MGRLNKMRMSLGVLLFSLPLAGAVTGGELPLGVAGTQPDQRPAAAPVIEQFTKGQAWYQQALTGITQPYPASLRFLEDQGAWYTPFNQPGMTGPYDIRGWHSSH